MKTLFDIAKLNGRFTEAVLLQQGFSQAIIAEARHCGLFDSVAGALQTIPAHRRALKLPFQEAVPVPIVESAPARKHTWVPSPTERDASAMVCSACQADHTLCQVAEVSGNVTEATQCPAPEEFKRVEEKIEPATESLMSRLLRDPKTKLVETFAVGTKVTKNVNGKAVQCVVTAVNGINYDLVTTDGHNTPMKATEAELGATPLDPAEKQHATAAAKAAPTAPEKPQTVTNPLG